MAGKAGQAIPTSNPFLLTLPKILQNGTHAWIAVHMFFLVESAFRNADPVECKHLNVLPEVSVLNCSKCSEFWLLFIVCQIAYLSHLAKSLMSFVFCYLQCQRKSLLQFNLTAMKFCILAEEWSLKMFKHWLMPFMTLFLTWSGAGRYLTVLRLVLSTFRVKKVPIQRPWICCNCIFCGAKFVPHCEFSVQKRYFSIDLTAKILSYCFLLEVYCL